MSLMDLPARLSLSSVGESELKTGYRNGRRSGKKKKAPPTGASRQMGTV